MSKTRSLAEITVGPTEMGRILGETRHAINDKLFRSLPKPEKQGQYPLTEILQFLWTKLSEKSESNIQDESELPSDKISKDILKSPRA